MVNSHYIILVQWIFWVGPFTGAALAALYHQIVIRAIPFKSKWGHIEVEPICLKNNNYSWIQDRVPN